MKKFYELIQKYSAMKCPELVRADDVVEDLKTLEKQFQKLTTDCEMWKERYRETSRYCDEHHNF